MRFYTSSEIYEEAQESGYKFEYEKEHAEVIYDYLRDFCLNGEIRSHRHFKLIVALPDSDNVACVFSRIRERPIKTFIYMGKPDVIGGYSMSGKKLDPAIIRNITLTDYWGPIKQMFEEYNLLVLYDTFDPNNRTQEAIEI
jgi:hypothetical protein